MKPRFAYFGESADDVARVAAFEVVGVPAPCQVEARRGRRGYVAVAPTLLQSRSYWYSPSAPFAIRYQPARAVVVALHGQLRRRPERAVVLGRDEALAKLVALVGAHRIEAQVLLERLLIGGEERELGCCLPRETRTP